MVDMKYPKVGIGVLIQNNVGQVLLGHRIGTDHGNDTWSFPGGHLDWGETVHECAIREVKEETGLDIHGIELITVYDQLDFIDIGKHYINIGTRALHVEGEPKNMEPLKCKGWKWFDLENLPENLMPPTKAIITRYRTSVLYDHTL